MTEDKTPEELYEELFRARLNLKSTNEAISNHFSDKKLSDDIWSLQLIAQNQRSVVEGVWKELKSKMYVIEGGKT